MQRVSPLRSVTSDPLEVAEAAEKLLSARTDTLQLHKTCVNAQFGENGWDLQV